jgi:hypothetical protein
MFNRNHVQNLIDNGSEPFEYKNPAQVNSGTPIVWFNIGDQFPASRIFIPLDNLECINNSAQPIQLYTNSPSEFITVPAYMDKPISKKPLQKIGFKNTGIGNIGAGEIIIQLRRLAASTPVVVTSK